MRNVEKERIETKLKLWDTPGFSQFLLDLENYFDIIGIPEGTEALKKMYQSRLKTLEEEGNKFKQTKLDL